VLYYWRCGIVYLVTWMSRFLLASAFCAMLQIPTAAPRGYIDPDAGSPLSLLWRTRGLWLPQRGCHKLMLLCAHMHLKISDFSIYSSVYLFEWDFTFLRLSVCLSVKMLLVLASTAIPGFSLLEIHEQDFCSVLHMYVFRSGVSSSTRGGVGLPM
jgi:hypothetical protein